MRFTLIVAALSGLFASASAFAIPTSQESPTGGHDLSLRQKRTMNVIMDMVKAVRLAKEMDAALPVEKRVAKALNEATDAATFEDDIDLTKFYETFSKRLSIIHQEDTDSGSDGPEGDMPEPKGEAVPDAPEVPEGEPVVVDECENLDDPCGGVPSAESNS